MTFFEAFNEIKKEHSSNDLIIYEIIFYLSKKVKDKLSYISNRNEEIDFAFNELRKQCIEYFINKKPLGHITKNTSFLGISIDVFDNILVPRNETEFVCQIARQKLLEKFNNSKISIVDLCSGTGNMGLYMKKTFKDSNVTCIDINPVSIENIKHNSKKNNLNVSTICGDYLKTITKNNLKFDVILMNPPYVAKNELDYEMTKYESDISFVNSNDPNEFYFNIFSNYQSIVNNPKKFLMVFEISSTQTNNLKAFLEKTDLNFEFYKDLSGNYRTLTVSEKQTI